MSERRIILGDRALPVTISAASIDPMLWAQAQALYASAPPGSALAQRGALVLIALMADPLRDATLSLAALAGYDVARLGGLVFGALEGAGIPTTGAESAFRAFAASLRAEQAAEEKPAPKPPLPEPTIPDPYPGLTRDGLDWPHAATLLAGKRSMEADNARTEWRAAGIAFEGGRIGEWVEQVGAALGFHYEAPAAG